MFRQRGRLDPGGHLRGEILRHLSSAEVLEVADFETRLQDDRGDMDREFDLHGPHSGVEPAQAHQAR